MFSMSVDEIGENHFLEFIPLHSRKFESVIRAYSNRLSPRISVLLFILVLPLLLAQVAGRQGRLWAATALLRGLDRTVLENQTPISIVSVASRVSQISRRKLGIVVARPGFSMSHLILRKDRDERPFLE